jgi:hypothetical protein
MRIHTAATLEDVREAARIARAEIEVSEHRSRTHKRAFEVHLTGESKRRPNGGSYGAGTGYAATWDQWGVFLAHIFEVDSESKCRAYADSGDFYDRTNYRFEGEWPTDAHGDHKFVPQGNVWGDRCEAHCSKCSAVQVWYLSDFKR